MNLVELSKKLTFRKVSDLKLERPYFFSGIIKPGMLCYFHSSLERRAKNGV